jgi:NAD(P)-dependent dehydrogenase (short-subunit alcohol dehydrogenase family)
MSNYLVVGGSGGIGSAICSELLQQQHQVWSTYKTKPSNLPNVTNIQYDVFGNEGIPQLPEVIDGIAYCVGAIQLKPFHRINPDDFIHDYRLQVLGAIKVIQQCLPALKKSSAPTIVLFSTVAMQMGFNFHSLVASSKGAVEGLTKALAAEFAPTIRVNCVAPSITNTPLAASLLNTAEKINATAEKHPLKKIGEPSDIANITSFLLSDKSKWITGQILHVDGGMSAIKL